jgi:hypothetical protein
MSDNYLFVFCADTHCGSTMGLMKPGWFPLHDGGGYEPGPTQQLIWKVWEAGWEKVAKERKGRKLIIVHVGDAVEGIHHATTQVVSQRVDEHEKIHINAMQWAMKKANFGNGDAIYYISGTEEHAGDGSRSEETIAEKMNGVIPMNENRKTWDVIRKTVNGIGFDISHHGATLGATPLTEENGLYQRMKAVYFDSLNFKQPIPKYWIRAHLHRFAHVRYDGIQGSVEGFVLPSFQMKTGYVYKRFNGRTTPSDIGLVWIKVDKDGSTSWDALVTREMQDEVGLW